jgi:hypothetical protein
MHRSRRESKRTTQRICSGARVVDAEPLQLVLNVVKGGEGLAVPEAAEERVGQEVVAVIPQQQEPDDKGQVCAGGHVFSVCPVPGAVVYL